ncbi:MAG: amidohydrolase family protein [Chloroflexi bacterium]|nr:amidohydrolase family protein [Chloroflexota bacterium]
MQAQRVDTIIHGGTVVTATSAFLASVAIKGERIAAVGPRELMPPADRSIDATGKFLLPGLIDCHVHLRPAGGDDWSVGPRAAAHAGLTTIIPFQGYNRDTQETLPQAIARLKAEAERTSVVDFGLHFILGNTPYILNGLPEAMGLGVTSYKMFMTYDNRSPDSLIARVMEIVGSHGGVMQLHCENGEVIEHLMNKAQAEGRVKPTDFPATCPPWAEAEAINRACLLGAMTNCPTYVVHLSTRLGLERIMQAQSQGQRVWTETCPQYLLLDEGEMERLGPLAKIGPPLRSKDHLNQEAMWWGSQHGYIACVASDHAPALREAKEPGWKNIFRNEQGQPIPFGAPSLETLAPLAYGEGVAKRGYPIWWLARVLSENPARIFGLYPRKGAIQPGSDADLCIWDPQTERTITAQEHHSTTGYTPYEGWKVKGRPWMTLLRGKVLLNPQGRLEQQPGYGKFLPESGLTPPIAGRVT